MKCATGDLSQNKTASQEGHAVYIRQEVIAYCDNLPWGQRVNLEKHCSQMSKQNADIDEMHLKLSKASFSIRTTSDLTMSLHSF